jgi:hypothetical protein
MTKFKFFTGTSLPEIEQSMNKWANEPEGGGKREIVGVEMSTGPVRMGPGSDRPSNGMTSTDIRLCHTIVVVYTTTD